MPPHGHRIQSPMNSDSRTSGAQPPAGPAASARRPFSLTRKAAGLLFISGQVGLDPQTQQLVPGGFASEFAQMMTNLTGILEAHQLSLADLVSVNVYLTTPDDYTRLNELYLAAFADPLPTRTTVIVQALPLGASVEIQGTAALGGAETA